jgi:hypothetical protein
MERANGVRETRDTGAYTKSHEHRLMGLGIGRAPNGAKPRRTDVRRPASEGPLRRPTVAINGIWY